jgi:O-antigen/teichoic acid export membrane protein
MINYFFSEEELGYYTSITIFIIVISTFVISFLYVIVPLISDCYIKGKYTFVIKKTINAVLLILSGTIVILVLCQFLGPIILKFIFCEKILPYLYLLVPTIIVSSIMAIVSVFNLTLLAIQKRNSVLFANFSGVVVCVFLIYPMVRYMGMAGSLYCLMAGMGTQLACLIFIFCNALRRVSNNEFMDLTEFDDFLAWTG